MFDIKTISLTVPIELIKSLFLKKKKAIYYGMYVEEYRHPDPARAFSICIVYFDKEDKKVKCEGMNFDEKANPTYYWTTLVSRFENNALIYSYESFPYMNDGEFGRTIGQGSLIVFPPTKSFISGNFTNDSSSTISFTAKRLTNYCPECNEYKLNSKSSPDDWQCLGKKVKERMSLYH